VNDRYTLTVNVLGNGTVQKARNRGPDPLHEAFELTARAEPGWVFSGWNGNLSGSGNPASVVLDRNVTIDATFTQTH
jgi:hypothetical protein